MVEVGKIYNVAHSRKGKFTMQVKSISGEWVSGVVVDSVAKAIMDYNFKYSGDEITVRDSHCNFSELNPPIKENVGG